MTKDAAIAVDPSVLASAPPQRSRWGLIAVLTLIYTYAFIDRSVLTLLVEPIKADLGLTDTQMGLLLGIAFAIFYGVLNVPAGYLVDRMSRRMIIGVSTATWSLATIGCGLAQNFWQLFLGRAGVGIAEATIAPASFSLIREWMPPEERGRAFSIFAMGPFLGGGLALILGGAIVGAAARGRFEHVPVLGGLAPWQIVLVLLGAAGLFIGLLALLLKEAPRTASDLANDGTTFRAAIVHMRQNRTLYLPLIGYAAFNSMITFGKSAWIPALLGRQFGLQPPEIGLTLGIMSLTVAPVGLLIGGWAMHLLAKRGRDIRLYGIVSIALTTIAVVLMPLSTDLTTTWVLHGVGLMFSGVFFAVGATTLAEMTPLSMMGKVSATYLLLQSVLGHAIGPLIVAVVAETFFVGPTAIGRALSLCGGVVGLCCLGSLLILTARLQRDRPDPAGAPVA